MKTATKRKASGSLTFAEEYRSALMEYSLHGGEESLGRAYELGRRAIIEKKSLMQRFGSHANAGVDPGSG